MERTAVLVGCGAMAGTWVKAARACGVRLTGLVDLDVSATGRLAARHGIEAPGSDDLRGTIARTRPDLVFDITVPSARVAVTGAALDAGCHVVCEKPLAPTMREARGLLARAEAAGRLLTVTQNRRFVPGLRRARALIETGVLGELASLHCRFFLAPHFGGFREAMRHPLLVDMAIHPFDAARFLAGATPETVWCREANPPGSWYAGGASASAVFGLPGGGTFTYEGSWAAPGLGTSWEGAWRVQGTRGALEWDGAEGLVAEIEEDGAGFLHERRAIDPPAPPDLNLTRGHESVLRQVLAALTGGPAPETRAADAIRSLAMTVAAVRSAETGRVEALEAP